MLTFVTTRQCSSNLTLCSLLRKFHVMMRGINHQNIFEDEEDNYQFINTLDRVRVRYDDQGNRLPPLCTFYAYCLMSNHVHLLLRVNQEDIGSTIKHLAFAPPMLF